MIVNAASPPRVGEFASGLVYSCSLPAVAKPRWAWLADTHICGDASAQRDGWQPARQLAEIARQISAARPHGLLVNGDIAWHAGTVEDYRLFRTLMRPATDLPMVLGVGNHDRRDHMLAVLAGRSGSEPSWIAAVVEQPPCRFLVLDSQIDPESVGGEVGAEQLEWLRTEIALSAHLRTILFVHHPGRSISEGCKDFDALARLARDSASIHAIVTGHDHALSVSRRGRVHRIGLPSSAFPFLHGTDCGWTEATLSAEGLQLSFHGTGGSSKHRLDWR